MVALLREWRKYGMRDIVVDKAAGRVWAKVGEKNCESSSYSPHSNPSPSTQMPETAISDDNH